MMRSIAVVMTLVAALAGCSAGGVHPTVGCAGIVGRRTDRPDPASARFEKPRRYAALCTAHPGAAHGQPDRPARPAQGRGRCARLRVERPGVYSGDLDVGGHRAGRPA